MRSSAKQDGLLLVLGVVGLPAELQAPVRQSGVEVLQVPHARPGDEQLAPDHADLRLDRALLVSGVRRAQGALEPVVRLERLEQAGPADAAPAGPASHARGVGLLGGVLLLTRKRINRSLESLNRNESGFAQ